MVVLVSSDGKEFTVERDVAEHLTIINGPQLEETDTPIPLPGVPSAALEKVLEYCEHHRGETLEERNHSEWDHHFIEGVDTNKLFSIITAANYLDVKPLLYVRTLEMQANIPVSSALSSRNLGTTAVTNMIKGKTPEQIRTLFNIANNVMQEEEYVHSLFYLAMVSRLTLHFHQSSDGIRTECELKHLD
ncbi:hypothetical protein PQX77_012653 [Marasmius sp. AFHP31]|nr:hypothetical protein PQX77_012653 [Marasmius sp. AFHP31]